METIVINVMLLALVLIYNWKLGQVQKEMKKHWEKIIDLAQTTDRRMIKFQQREVEVDNLLNTQTELIKLLDNQIGETVKLMEKIANVVETLTNKTIFHETRIGQLENTTQEYFTYPEWKEMITKEKERIRAEAQDYSPGTTVQGEEGGVGYTTHKYDGKEVTIVNNPEWNKSDVPNGKESGPLPDVDSIRPKENK